MGQESFVGGSLSGFDPETVWTQSELQEFTELREKVEIGEILTSADLNSLTKMYEKGIADPATRPHALASLINLENEDVLASVFEQYWMPPDERQTILDLGDIQDPNERAYQLGTDLMIDLQGDRALPVLRYRGMLEPVDGMNISTGGPPRPDIDKLLENHKNNDLGEVRRQLINDPDPKQLLIDAGSKAYSLLIDLAADENFGPLSQEILLEYGSDIIPMIEEAGSDNPYIENIIKQIQTGEAVNPETIRQDVNTIANNGDIVEFKEILLSDPELVSDAILEEKNDQALSMLIDLLGDTERRVQIQSMDLLHEWDSQSQIEYELLEARQSNNPDVRSNAERLLDERMDIYSHIDSAPFMDRDNPFNPASLQYDGASFGTTTPDVESIIQGLSSTDTCLETLSSIAQMGKIAMPSLCQIWFTNRGGSTYGYY